MGALSASGTSAESINLTAPATAGTYYYGACVDAVTGESSTTNNCSGSVQVDVSDPPTQTGPGLRVYGVVVSGNPWGNRPGGNISLSAGVRNDGDDSSVATTLRYYRSTDATITTSDSEEGTETVGALAAGAASSSESISLTLPSTAGTYYYGACVDSVSGESDTTNNCSGSVQVDVEATQPQQTPASVEVREGPSATRGIQFGKMGMKRG